MRKIDNYDAINENGVKLVPGIYGLVITDVIDYPERNYLEVHFDIAKGEFKDYYKNLKAATNKDSGKIIRSYVDNAMVFFKRFITAVEKSNTGYVWDWDEKKLIGKNVIGEFGEEEYINSDNELAVITKLQNFRSLEAFKNNECKIPEKKLLSDEEKKKVVKPEDLQPEVGEVDDSDLPF